MSDGGGSWSDDADAEGRADGADAAAHTAAGEESCTAVPFSARTRIGPGPSSISTVPTVSVRRTRAPAASTRPTVAGAG